MGEQYGLLVFSLPSWLKLIPEFLRIATTAYIINPCVWSVRRGSGCMYTVLTCELEVSLRSRGTEA